MAPPVPPSARRRTGVLPAVRRIPAAGGGLGRTARGAEDDEEGAAGITGTSALPRSAADGRRGGGRCGGHDASRVREERVGLGRVEVSRAGAAEEVVHSGSGERIGRCV